MKVVPYVFYPGNCKEAFEFYEKVFGGKIEFMQTYGDMPPMEGMPKLPEEYNSKIMHASIKLGEDQLFASDTGPWGSSGNGSFSIAVATDSEVETDKIFAMLSEGGNVVMPLAMQFWGAKYGKVTDRFGINWDINFDMGGKGE